jgi:hypothetical protein
MNAVTAITAAFGRSDHRNRFFKHARYPRHELFGNDFAGVLAGVSAE